MLPEYKNILLVSGTGRNVGKTFMSCRIIEKFKTEQIIAVKISPHFHEIRSDAAVLISDKRFQVIQEKSKGAKDSMKMLEAGAVKVYYVQVLDKDLQVAFDHLMNMMPLENPLIIESGALHQIIKPGITICLTKQKPDKICPERAQLLKNDIEKEQFLEELKFIDGKWI